jgi:hypothetical protein
MIRNLDHQRANCLLIASEASLDHGQDATDQLRLAAECIAAWLKLAEVDPRAVARLKVTP